MLRRPRSPLARGMAAARRAADCARRTTYTDAFPAARASRRFMASTPHSSGRRTLLVGALLAVALALAADDRRPRRRGARRPRADSAPPNDASVDTLPPFAWNPVAGADQLRARGLGRRRASTRTSRSFRRRNTRATLTKVVPNGEYWWHVRAVTPGRRARPVVADAQTFTMAWTAKPSLLAPVARRDARVPGRRLPAGLDASSPAPPSTSSSSRPIRPSARSSGSNGPVTTSATSFTLPRRSRPGTYYWAVTPLDAEGHAGTPSTVASFDWTWPSDDDADPHRHGRAGAEVFDPLFSWTRVEGAAGYEVEVNASSDWAPGSKRVLRPASLRLDVVDARALPRAARAARQQHVLLARPADRPAAGTPAYWTTGPTRSRRPSRTFRRRRAPSVKNLRMRDHAGDPYDGLDPATVSYPRHDRRRRSSTWDPVPGAVELPGRRDTVRGRRVRLEPNSSSTGSRTVTGTAWTPLGWGWNNVKPYPSALAGLERHHDEPRHRPLLLRARPADRTARPRPRARS